MCLSAITWAGYDHIYYFFPYQDTRDSFEIPHDLRILEEVFHCKDGNYARENRYWRSEALMSALEDRPAEEKAKLLAQAERLRQIYAGLSETYQASKADSPIPLP